MGSALTGAGGLGSHTVCLRSVQIMPSMAKISGLVVHCAPRERAHHRSRAGRYQPPSDCELVDYGNATVLPGLINVHVHLVGDSEVMALERVPEYSPEEIDRVVTEALRRQLAAGGRRFVTSATGIST